MGAKPGTYKAGDNYVICDYSGFKIRASDARITWDGLLVHKKFWEPRQPQDFVRGVRDDSRPSKVRSEGEDVFLDTNDVQASDL
jgi:hypothetical protein